ncbi:MAG: hypothetical protein ABSA02_16745 [Trebonia sp.]
MTRDGEFEELRPLLFAAMAAPFAGIGCVVEPRGERSAGRDRP